MPNAAHRIPKAANDASAQVETKFVRQNGTNNSNAKLSLKSRYITSLDGLRALSVIAVLLYHLNVPWFKGGLLGVTVFFVLSGFLITSLLLVEIRRTHTINLKKFWSKRLKRIVPAVVACIIFTAAACTFFSHPLLTKMRNDVLPSLLFINNWWQIFNNISYFDALGAPSPLTHLWSLAVEMQFYLIWPVCLLVAVKKKTAKHTIRNFLLIFSVLSAIEMAVLYTPGVDPSRVYYGTDTRAFSLLLGAALAFIMPNKTFIRTLDDKNEQLSIRETAHNFNPKKVVLRLFETPITLGMTEIAGIVSILALLGIMIFTNGYSAFPYYGGIFLCSILSTIIIASIVQRNSLIARLLSVKPLTWLGERSYGLYLWHYPILLLTTPQNITGAVPLWARALQLILIMVVTEVSYKFIEEPIRRSKFDNQKSALRLAVVLLVVSIISLFGLVFIPDTNILSKEGTELIQTEINQELNDTPAEMSESSYDILMFGDSVSLRLLDPFAEMFPAGHLDAQKSRQFTAAFDLLKYYQDSNLVGPVVVYALGTNGVASTDTIEELIKNTGNTTDNGKQREIFFINTRSHTDWMDSMNKNLEEICNEYENVHLIDWYTLSQDQTELFDGDGTHLSAYGTNVYMRMIMNAVYPYLPEQSQQAALETFIPENARDVISPKKTQDELNAAVQALATTIKQNL